MFVFILFCLFILCFDIYANTMKKDHSLQIYHAHHSFKESSKSSCTKKINRKKKKPIFVIQKHDSSHKHFDFRLEIGGVLVSWAIPKGPSLNPRNKRLAIRTNDHSLEYAQFEGVIPKNTYGAGTVMIWDYGTFEPYILPNKKTPSLKEQLKKGLIKIIISGNVLQGAFSLIHTHEDRWLLIKMGDKYASTTKNLTKTVLHSALSHRTMEQIKKA